MFSRTFKKETGTNRKTFSGAFETEDRTKTPRGTISAGFFKTKLKQKCPERRFPKILRWKMEQKRPEKRLHEPFKWKQEQKNTEMRFQELLE